MSKDVEFHFYNGTWRVKSLTEKARQAMGETMGGPWQLAAEVYWQSIDDSNREVIESRLQAMGLKTQESDDEQFSF